MRCAHSRRRARPAFRLDRIVIAIFGLAIALAVAMAATPAPALAHAALIGTDPVDGAVLPEAPSVITLTFNEPVQPVESGFRLLDATGTSLALTATRLDRTIEITLPAALSDGSYAVGWQVISADGHPIAGAVSFAIGAASGAPLAVPAVTTDARAEALQAVVQGVGYVSLLAAAGLALFQSWLLPPADGQLLRRLIVVVALGGLVAALAQIPLSVIRQQSLGLAAVGDPAGWVPLVGADAWLALAAVGVGLVAIIVLQFAVAAPAQRWGVLAAGAVAVASVVFTGHTRVFTPGWLMVTADLLHAATGAIWFGGLVGLAVYFRAHAGRGERSPLAPTTAATVVARFSGVAGAVIGLLGITGVVMGWIILEASLTALLTTTYGRLLIIKVIVVAVVVGIGAWNRFRLIPAVRRADATAPWRPLRRMVAAEAVILVGVVLLTGVLVNQSPVAATSNAAASEAAPAAAPQAFTAELGDAMVTGEVTPGLPGPNQLTVRVRDHHDMPLAVIGNVQVALSLPARDLGPLRVEATPTAEEGTYHADVLLPLAGAWEVTLSGRTSRFEAPSASFDLEIPE